SDRIPSLAEADARIGRIIGNPGYRLNLGALSSDVLADVGRGTFGLGLGLTNQITIFGRIPLVRTRVQTRLGLNPASADAGLTPDDTGQLPFFQQFDAALSTLSSKLAAGDYNADPALAEATLADGTALRSDLFGLLADPATAAPVVPTATSATGAAVLTRIEGLQNTLATGLNVPGFAADPVLPADPLGEDGLRQLLSGPLALRAGQSLVTFRGDAEAGAAITLVDRWDRGRRRGGLRAALSGLVRFPTGVRAQPDRPLDLGTGDGQTDMQVDLVTDFGAGAFGARLAGTYVRQLPSNVTARVAPPSQPFVGLERAALVRRNPGDIISIDVRPFYRLARTLALQAGIQYWSRTADQVTYASASEALPGVDANVLAEGTAASAALLSAGLTYSNPGRFGPGGSGLPVDASWSYERVLRSKKGLVPNTHRVQASLRMYFGLW
ncbi:MAG TPA: hypothetical protein VGP44_12250, partial [Gemmatimonadales bacterium]|nr:hypothetical protein [Gemmatimonadales bacterium]